MFDSNLGADVTVWMAIAGAVIATIVIVLVRDFRHKGKRPWPAFFAGIYDIFLLLLFLFGIATQVNSEGFGFLPLLVLTTPWSWLLMWLLSRSGISDISYLGDGLTSTFFAYFISLNILAGSANSCFIYFLLKRREKKLAEDEAWEQARRNR